MSVLPRLTTYSHTKSDVRLANSALANVFNAVGRDSSAGRVIATAWTVRGSNRNVGEIFRKPPDWPRSPLSFLYKGYRISFPGVKGQGRNVDYQPASSAEVKKRVELYLYFPSGPSWSVLGWTLPVSGLLELTTFQVQISNTSFGYVVPKNPSQFRGPV